MIAVAIGKTLCCHGNQYDFVSSQGFLHSAQWIETSIRDKGVMEKAFEGREVSVFVPYQLYKL